MLSQPAWFHRLDEILALLRGFDTRYLDRQAGREAVERYARAAHRHAIPSPVRAYAAWWSSALSFRL